MLNSKQLNNLFLSNAPDELSLLQSNSMVHTKVYRELDGTLYRAKFAKLYPCEIDLKQSSIEN